MCTFIKRCSVLLCVAVLAAICLSPAALAARIVPGDVNGDSSIAMKDLTALRQYLAGGYSVTINTKNADVNKDGAVNVKDLIKLRRYLAGGYDETLPPPSTIDDNSTPWVPIR